jgi:D-amino-acid dehydrogenase
MKSFHYLSVLSQVAFLPLTDPFGLRIRQPMCTAKLPASCVYLNSPSLKKDFTSHGEQSESQTTCVGNFKKDPKVKVGIIGGGIAGVSVAHALTKRLRSINNCEITVLEGDPMGRSIPQDSRVQPKWVAATARNANSIVPAASMHIFSRVSVLWKVLSDTSREWYTMQLEHLKGLLTQKGNAMSGETERPRIDTLCVAPPYFALHVFRCLGPTATHEERLSFLRFGWRFLTAAFRGNAAADERAQIIHSLAQANRQMYLSEIERLGIDFATDVGHSQGFLSIHRSEQAACETLKEAREYGEEAQSLTKDEAVILEPHLENLPIKPLFFVRRLNDYTAGCEKFVRRWIRESEKYGVQYHIAEAKRLAVTRSADDGSAKFQVLSEDGVSREFDYLVLAAGVQTPLLAAQLGVGGHCPTYPLRGFSLTVFAFNENERNLLRQPISVDSMYCTSITPWMARWAGFGEFVGYRDKAVTVPSMAPSVMARYANTLFPEAVPSTSNDPVSCFRPISPDDLPLVGEVDELPGLFLHTGHGTLGWTLGLTTGDCLAQALADKIEGTNSSGGTFALATADSIERSALSPNRFVTTPKLFRV